MDLLPLLASLCLGVIFGYLGQRARMCFIGGMRDLYLVRDTYLIKGLLAFFIAALVGFVLFRFVSPALKTFPWVLNGDEVFLARWGKMNITAKPSPMLPVPGDPITWNPGVWSHIILAIIGGIGLGFFSVIAGGCPFRQYVMAAEGSKSALAYLLGLFLGAIAFHKLIAPLIKLIF